jgi:hypothetical protein
LGATVTVALKHPNGIICRLHQMVEVEERLPGGGVQKVKIARVTGQQFKLNGYLRRPQGNEPPLPASPGSFALTHGVDKDLFEAWLAQNQDLDLVRNNLVFASEKANYTMDEAREKKALKSGLEPIDPNKLPRGLASFGTGDKAA